MPSSNRDHLKKMAALALIILGLGFYAYKVGPKTQVSYKDCLNEPEKCRGQEIAVLGVSVISQDQKNLVLKDCHGPVLVKGADKEIQAEYVSVKGIFTNKDSSLALTQIRTHPEQYLKHLVSLVAMLLVGASFFKEFRFDSQEKVFKRTKPDLSA